jgi:hypothetical protein
MVDHDSEAVKVIVSKHTFPAVPVGRHPLRVHELIVVLRCGVVDAEVLIGRIHVGELDIVHIGMRGIAES